MTMDRTLKHHGGLARSRSVLTRDERVRQLMEEGKFDPATNSPLGLPKLRVKHSKAGTKSKKAAEEAPAAEAAAGAEAQGGAPAKAEAPAKGKPEASAKGKGEAPKGKAEKAGKAKE